MRAFSKDVLWFCSLLACVYPVCVCFGTQSYDQHLNMVLGDVEETVTTVEVDEDTYEEIVRVSIICVIFQSHHSETTSLTVIPRSRCILLISA